VGAVALKQGSFSVTVEPGVQLVGAHDSCMSSTDLQRLDATKVVLYSQPLSVRRTTVTLSGEEGDGQV
jgi:hypothetical protein